MTSSTAEIYYEPTGCNCDGTSYSKSAINAAATEALQLASQGKTLGKDKYPHAYNDYEHFSFSHAQKPYLEFPVQASGTYDGGSPGADRVVIGSIAEDYSSAVYCAVITHDGQKSNGFAECADDTMNVRGKGSYEGGDDDEVEEGGQGGGRKHRKAHHHGGRKLIQRIDL